MLRITRRQVEVLSIQQESDFESRAIAHLRAIDAHHFGAMTDSAQRDALRRFRLGAERCGATTEAQVVLFAEIACLLGGDFMDNEACDWARALLEAESTDLRRTLEYVRDTAIEKAARRESTDA